MMPGVPARGRPRARRTLTGTPDDRGAFPAAHTRVAQCHGRADPALGALPAAGTVTRSGALGYLPQDPRTGDLDVLARDRILSARGLDEVVRGLREAEGMMASADTETHERGMRRYARLDAEFTAKGGY